MSAFSYPARPANSRPAPSFRHDDRAEYSDSDCSTLTDENESDEDESQGWIGKAEGADKASEAGSAHESDDDEFPPLDLNYDALKHIASYYIPGDHGRCTEITPLPEGSYHEIRLLQFEDGWSCIGRLVRDCEEPLAVLESEVATVRYVRQDADIPAPEVYFVNPNPVHVVGAAFTLLERLPGAHLYKIWDELGLEHKKGVIDQITSVLARLADLEFDRIGSLLADGSVGPLENDAWSQCAAPAFATTEEYMLSNMPHATKCSEEMIEVNQSLREELLRVVEEKDCHDALNPPFRLIHTDFDAQNMLFDDADPSQPPQLTGIIDWDNSRTGLLYELFEYPIFIQDIHWSPELYTENKIVRKHFVRCLANKYPKGSRERQVVKKSFRMKTWVLQNFRDMWVTEDDEVEIRNARNKLEEVRSGKALAYDGRLDWEPDSELESEDGDD